MLVEQQGFYLSLSARAPGLVEVVRAKIEESERQYSKGQEWHGGFLWEHTALVAATAWMLAERSGEDADLAALTALYHDAGKFFEGQYHCGDRAEEVHAARVAIQTLSRSGLERQLTGQVVRSLRALYNAKAHRNTITDIVHDADFLAKLGQVGAATFFVKSAVRGFNMESAIVDSLSKELTYAAVLPANMRTPVARAIAERKAARTLRFYRALLAELRQDHGADFRIRSATIAHPAAPAHHVTVRLVMPRTCRTCGGGWRVALSTEKGLKCDKLKATVRCRSCDQQHEVAFCLPELGA
jgi:putative nucleotidyltransferase with HDIG domain